MQIIDEKKLRQWCRMSEAECAAAIGATNIGTDASPLWFKDRGGEVLAVAHLDYINSATHFQVLTLQPTRSVPQKYVYSMALDDRLGAYLIAEVLPQMGVNADILFTTNEERGKSTGAMFAAVKQYNWLFELDRHGDDVVGYQYEDKAWNAAVKAAKWQPGNGSYSDIADIDLSVLGFNFGVGYYNAHQLNCYADVTMVERCVKRFMDFWRLHKDTRFPHEHKTSRYQNYGNYAVTTYYPRNTYSNTWPQEELWDEIDNPSHVTDLKYRPCDFCGSDDGLYWVDALSSNLCGRCCNDEIIEAKDDVWGPCMRCGAEFVKLDVHELRRGNPVCKPCLKDMLYGIIPAGNKVAASKPNGAKRIGKTAGDTPTKSHIKLIKNAA